MQDMMTCENCSRLISWLHLFSESLNSPILLFAMPFAPVSPSSSFLHSSCILLSSVRATTVHSFPAVDCPLCLLSAICHLLAHSYCHPTHKILGSHSANLRTADSNGIHPHSSLACSGYRAVRVDDVRLHTPPRPWSADR